MKVGSSVGSVCAILYIYSAMRGGEGEIRPNFDPTVLSLVLSIGRVWGVLWLAAARSNIFLRVVCRGVIFLGVDPASTNSSLPPGKAFRPVKPRALPVSLRPWLVIRPPTDFVSVVSRLLAQTVVVSLVSSSLSRVV